MMEPVYSDRVIAFIDILGFRALVQKLGVDPSLHAKIHKALSRIKSLKDFSLQTGTAQSELQVSVFSDSIVISGEEGNIHGIIWSAINLQCSLLISGILVRGGISRGRTVHANDILYGEGMLDAYNLESKAAIYPRIVVAPKLLSEIKPNYRGMFLAQDHDGLWFLDFFSLGLVPENTDVLLDDGLDPHEEALKSFGKKIDEELSLLTDVGQLAKWNWLKNRHVIALTEFADLRKPRLWHRLEQPPRKRRNQSISAKKAFD